MKTIVFFLITLCTTYFSYAQYDYEPSEEYPYGRPNPEASKNILDYEELIGVCQCKSETRKQDGTWDTPKDMTWKFKYIMNGMAIQDETLKSDGKHSGSIRQFDQDSAKWYVHYYSAKRVSKTLPVWIGTRKGDKMILYKEHKAPNGTDGFYRLTFSDISKSGFNWVGEWVDKTEKTKYLTWKISCKR